MKILSLGLDNSILNQSSALARRVVRYGELVEKYSVIVPNKKSKNIKLSEKVYVYGSGGGHKISQLIKILKLAKKLWQEEKYDIITVQDQYYLALIGWLIKKKFNVGLEIQVHGFEKYLGLRELIAKYVLPRADAVRCVSQRLKGRLVNELGVKEEKITVVPIYVEIFQIPNFNPQKSNNNFIFLTVGRLMPVKNIGMQIEAMMEVVRKHPKAELWIIGDGLERIRLEKLCYELQVASYVKFLGWKNDLEKYYQQAGAFLLTSNYEGWGLAVIEAASFGLPIIMTDAGCAGEVIRNGESGLVIGVGDKQKLVEAMIRIFEDGNLRIELGVNAKLAASRLPTEEETLELYKKSWKKAFYK